MFSDWRWAAARAAGTSHARTGLPCQDAALIRTIDGPAGSVLAAIVSDGAGSASHARDGARTVVRVIAQCAAIWFADRTELPTNEDVASWVEHVRADLRVAADARGGTLRDYAATLVACFVTGTATLVAHVGDGGCVLDGEDEGWAVGSWPAAGEFANTTYFVTDEPRAQLRVSRFDRPAGAVAVFSDGIEDLVLQRRERRPHPDFFTRMMTPVRSSAASGRDRALSRGLRGYLNSEVINTRTDDDKSLVLAARP